MTEKSYDSLSFIFSVLLFPELINKSKDDMIGYIDAIKKDGKLTDEEYKKTIEFIDRIEEIKGLMKEYIKNDNKR